MSELDVDVRQTRGSPAPTRPPTKEEPKKIQDGDAWVAVEAALGGQKMADLVKMVAALNTTHR